MLSEVAAERVLGRLKEQGEALDRVAVRSAINRAPHVAVCAINGEGRLRDLIWGQGFPEPVGRENRRLAERKVAADLS